MGYKREDIRDVSPLSLKKLNDNIMQLWQHSFGNIDFADLSNLTKKIINNKVGTADFNTTMIQTQSQISLRAYKSDVDSLTGRVSTNESNLTIQANQISSKVSTTDYNGTTIASLINQTSNAISASAINIDLTGFVTFNSLSGDGTSTINGNNISTGTIAIDKLTTASANAIIKLFENVNGGSPAIDASYNLNQGFGSAIRLKWDNYNYVYVGSNEIDLYIGGVSRVGFYTGTTQFTTGISCPSLTVNGVTITGSTTVAKFG